MDFVQATNGHPSNIILGTFAAVSALGFIILAISRVRKDGKGTAIAVAAIALLGLGGLSVLAFTSPNYRAQKVEAREALSEHYGIDLTRDEMVDLEYPNSIPSKGFQSYGSIERVVPAEGGYEERKLRLVADRGEILLVSAEDGQEFKPLKARE